MLTLVLLGWVCNFKFLVLYSAFKSVNSVTLSLLLFVFSVVIFAFGPMLLRMQKQKVWRNFLDGFTLVTVGGIALFHLIPEALVHGG